MPRSLALGLALTAATVAPAEAQFGAIEGLLSQVTDLSFHAGVSRLEPRDGWLDTPSVGMPTFGIELLFEVGAVRRPAGPPVGRDTTVLELTAVEVNRAGGRADTVWTYVPRAVAAYQPMDTIWTFELGVGYSQVSGFRAADPALELRGAVRDLPSATFYASYERTGTYFGMRTGFMRTESLQLATADGGTFQGSAEAFLLGGVIGQSVDVRALTLFIETGYLVRYFPSVEWNDDGDLPPGIERDLRLSGPVLSVGVQFRLGLD